VSPEELWDVLNRYQKPVAVISHTGATGMGTDWAAYQNGIDNRVENIVEIYQGARVSYEGAGAPQPTAGLRPGEPYTADNGVKNDGPPEALEDFGKFQSGLYQNALAIGHKLGVFASSDHISQNVSFGGAYVKDFSREGLIEAFNARRTVGATDKIFLEFSCNGHLLGSAFETREKPALLVKVEGTAPIRQVTVIRNEKDWRVLPGQGKSGVIETTDEAPMEGENRYYIRVEQEDGNMAWASPVWVTWKKQ
jgi:hypothetical protein